MIGLHAEDIDCLLFVKKEYQTSGCKHQNKKKEQILIIQWVSCNVIERIGIEDGSL